MYLRPDDLLKYGSCYPAYSFMTRYYPDGAELTEIMRHKYMTPHFLHFGFDHLSTNDEEKKLYYELLKIDCENKASIFHCEKITNSSFCCDSAEVVDGSYVYDSSQIRESQHIHTSSSIENSSYIANSSFVYDSNQVANATNITKSSNVAYSEFIIGSSSVYQSKDVTNSNMISDSEGINNCLFCSNCLDLANSMFCWKTEGEGLLFNKPISSVQMEAIQRQYHSIMRDVKLKLVEDWGSIDGREARIHVNRNYIKQYETAPAQFWNWVKTLPGYDPMILYRITFQPHLLGE